MKTLLVAALLLLTTAAHAVTPFSPEVANRFAKIEKTSTDGAVYKHELRVTYDVAALGGTAGTYPLNVSLPAGAVIERGYMYFPTAFSYPSTTPSTIALTCEDAGNILAARALAPYAALSIQPTDVSGPIANMKASIAAECGVVAVVANATSTAGKLILFLDYSVAE